MRNSVEKWQIFGSSLLLQYPVRHTIKYWKWVSIWIYKWCKEHCVLFQSHQASSSLIHVYIWMAIRRDFTCRDRNTSDVNWIAWLKFYAHKIKSAEGIGVSTNLCKEIVYKMCILNSISDFQTEIANIKVGRTKWKVGITSAEYT